MENKLEGVIPSGLGLVLDGFINWNKEGIFRMASLCEKSVKDGECDAIDALIFTKKLSEFAKALDEKIRPLAESVSVGKEYTKYNVKITEAMNGVKYDYSGCDDPEWQQLSEAAETASNALKERQKFLQAVTKPIEVVDTETGETSTIKPPVKSGKLGFNLSIK